MSSTTDRSRERGQVLVLFAGGLVALFLVAALALDVGVMLLERRDQQNAADAAALAGARYVATAATYSGSCAGGGTNPAVVAACEIALANDFDNADAAENVFVHIPPLHGEFSRNPGHIEVQIDATRGSIFAGVIGRAAWPIGTMAVAANQQDVHYEFGMLALSPDGCKAIAISGSGVVNSASNIQSNSTGEECGGSNIGFSRTGAGVLNVTAPTAVCRSGGDLQDQGSGTLNCTVEKYSFSLPDPLEDLPAPAKPALADPMKEVDTVLGTVIPLPLDIPKNCPGATGTDAPDEDNPTTCVLGGGGSTQANRLWILSPGLYPAGIEIKGGVTAYLLPGIYWIGGGGLKATEGSMISVNNETDRAAAVCIVGATPPCTGGGGILIYNSKLPASPAGPIALGGNGITLKLQPFEYPFKTSTIDLVIFQDRTVALAGDDITLNGSDSEAAEVRGIVYAPQGDVKVNGSDSVFSMDQVIAYTFQINGSGGTINILHEAGVDAIISAVGLVE